MTFLSIVWKRIQFPPPSFHIIQQKLADYSTSSFNVRSQSTKNSMVMKLQKEAFKSLPKRQTVVHSGHAAIMSLLFCAASSFVSFSQWLDIKLKLSNSTRVNLSSLDTQKRVLCIWKNTKKDRAGFRAAIAERNLSLKLQEKGRID